MSELDDQVKGIRGWLGKQGYPFEMMIARELHLQGLGFVQSWHYEDPDTSEAREIDILAHLYAYAKNILLLQAVIECKYSEQPIVAFTYETMLKSPIEYWVPCNGLGHNLLSRIITEKLYDKIPVFSKQNTIAYNLKQVFVDEDGGKKGRRDAAFEAIMSVVKASDALSKIYTTIKTFPSPDKSEEKPSVYIGMPTIVVGAPLFICYLDHKDQIAIEPRRSILLEWNYPKVGAMMIRVMQEGELVKLGKDIVDSIEIFNGQMQDYIS